MKNLVAVLAAAGQLAVLCGHAPESRAMAVGGAPPPTNTAPAAASRASAPHSAPAAPSLDLVQGQIDSIDLPRKTVTIGGKTLALGKVRLHVFYASGRRGSAEALRAGMKVRFALEPGAAEPRAIALIYIDGNP